MNTENNNQGSEKMSENKLEMKPRTTNATLHPAVPKEDYDGNTWAPQQVEILNDFATDLEAWVKGEGDAPRFIIEAVAGSGKTTIIRAMIDIVGHIEASLKTIATAFNVSIALILKGVLKAAQKGGFHGATTIGLSLIHISEPTRPY